ncbi:hypothetical protein niasHS_011322 [Heterodera schachtii]|uniref:BACK domain-containing protein n=1 Tax=Heterodera schachtii TaxID=97005 RepID=A0ABD2IJS9_HETSC
MAYSSANFTADVEIPDVEAAAFKVMLSFIYADGLRGLNGDNAMAVIYAAKKYNISDLVEPCLEISFSELRNVFFAYAQTRLFDLEDYANNCLAYIDKNADALLKSEELLQIEQNLLCEIFAQNFRQMLGSALFRIRFPLVSKMQFSVQIVPSGILTADEVIGVENYHNHPNFYGISDGLLLTPSEELRRMRITEMERMQKISSPGRYDNGHKMGMAKPDTLADRMKLLLSTAKGADAHFLVGLSDKKEATSANCPVVEVPDVEPAAFKIMLSFIYTDDLNELNGDNAMAVLYAAKKFNIHSLVRPSLQIPISELRNIFLAYAQALLFELEDFASKCLRYICVNAAHLFESDDFLQINQKMLCVLLDNDRLLISDEFEIWNAALRWADEKCRQNGIECSSAENHRLLLGPALFKIRFPNIHEDDFAKCVVPSDVLTEKELFGVYQFNPILICFFVECPGSKGNRRGTLTFEIEKVSEFAGESVESRRFGDTVEIKGLAWKIGAQISKNTEGNDEKKCLGFYLLCDAKIGGPWDCVFSATYRIVLEKSEAENPIGTRCDCVINRSPICRGFRNLITFGELMDPRNGFYDQSEDKVTLAIDVTVKDEKTEKLILDQSKPRGTLSMEIGKMSEFSREINWSERKSETVYINGIAWEIVAQINPKNGSIDSNEKWLYISLLCDAPKEENWSCKCSGNVRIVSQKKGVSGLLRKFDDLVFDNNEYNRRCVNFISFAGLMDPSKGFYDKTQDKVTLVIYVTVKEAKTEENS